MLIIDQKNIFKFLKISILWPFTFYSDPALAYCEPARYLQEQQVTDCLIINRPDFTNCQMLKALYIVSALKRLPKDKGRPVTSMILE